MWILRALFFVALGSLLAGIPGPSAPSAGLASSATPGAGTYHTPDEQRADSERADEVLRELASKYEYLDGVTVRMGSTPNGEEAVAYYTRGEIVISTQRTVDIDKILEHEVWHIIDWRDNGRLDWGENLPPRDAADYLSN
jgi:hypothetical protein